MTNHNYITGILSSRTANSASVVYTSPEIMNMCTAQATATWLRLGLPALSDEVWIRSVVVEVFCSGTGSPYDGK